MLKIISQCLFHLHFRTKHKVCNQDICIFVVITDASMVLCAKIGPSILNADLSDLAGECSRLLDQVCLWRLSLMWEKNGNDGKREEKEKKLMRDRRIKRREVKGDRSELRRGKLTKESEMSKG